MLRRATLLVLTLATLTTALAGCLGNGNVLLQALPTTDLPKLPALGFAKEVAIDKGHRGGEPSIVVDGKGSYFVSAPSGMVTTVFNSALDPRSAQGQGPQNRESFIWKSSDQGASWQLLSLTPPPLPPLRGDAAPGGADTDLAVDGCDTIYFTDLWAGNIAISHSDDAGATWTGVPVSGARPALDRQWLAAGKECGTVYLLFQSIVDQLPQLWVLKSTDKGMTFPQQTLVLDCNTDKDCYSFNGQLILDDASGNLYFPAGLADGKGLWVFKSADQGKTWSKTAVPMSDADQPLALLPALASDAAGNLYADLAIHRGGSFNVYLTRSSDQGATWSPYMAMSGPEASGTELFPWVAAGDAGRVAVAWMGVADTVDKPDDVKGDWFIFMALSENADGAQSSWQVSKVSERSNHQGGYCTLGLGCTLPQPVGTRGNRNLADFFEIAVDRDGRAIATWPDDTDTADQFVALPYFGRQVDGPLLHPPLAKGK